MKKIFILPFFIILFSFVPNDTNPEQEKKYKIVWLTTDDWKVLEKISTKGKNTTTVVDVKTRSNIIHKVQYKSTDINFNKELR